METGIQGSGTHSSKGLTGTRCLAKASEEVGFLVEAQVGVPITRKRTPQREERLEARGLSL